MYGLIFVLDVLIGRFIERLSQAAARQFTVIARTVPK
jgi:hypothetical protein